MSGADAKAQRKAYDRDTRSAIGKRHLLYDLERHAFEASPLTQLFGILTKRRPSWWQSIDASMLSSQDGSVSRSATRGASGGPPAGDSNVYVPNAERDPAELVVIPDTVVWENNIPKGWFYFDAKEKHVHRRKVETKAIQRAFLQNARYSDDVVAVLYSLNGTSDGGDPEMIYQFINASALEGFLFENGRGKGTSILQRFVPSLNATHNDMIEAVWSPALFHAHRRQNIHEIADDRVDVNDRCITFEGRTHLSRLVQCTSRLRGQVKRVTEALAQHFHETEPKQRLSRVVAYFKMTDTSELMLLYVASVRVMRVSDAAVTQGPPGAQQRPTANDSGATSTFYKKYRVCLDLATVYSRRPPAAAVRDARSVMARLQDQNKNLVQARSTPEPTASNRGGGQAPRDDGVTPRRRPGDDTSAHANGLSPDDWMRSAARGGGGSRRSRGETGTSAASPSPQPMVRGIKASVLGFVVRDEPAKPRAASATPAARTPAHGRRLRDEASLQASPTRAAQLATVDEAVAALVRSGDFENVADAPVAQRAKVCRVLDKCIRRAGVANVRGALLQAHDEARDDLSDCEKMELLALQLHQLQRTQQRTPSPHSTRGDRAARSPTRTRSPSSVPVVTAPRTWAACREVRDVLADVVYQVDSAARTAAEAGGPLKVRVQLRRMLVALGPRREEHPDTLLNTADPMKALTKLCETYVFSCADEAAAAVLLVVMRQVEPLRAKIEPSGTLPGQFATRFDVALDMDRIAQRMQHAIANVVDALAACSLVISDSAVPVSTGSHPPRQMKASASSMEPSYAVSQRTAPPSPMRGELGDEDPDEQERLLQTQTAPDDATATEDAAAAETLADATAATGPEPVQAGDDSDTLIPQQPDHHLQAENASRASSSQYGSDDFEDDE